MARGKLWPGHVLDALRCALVKVPSNVSGSTGFRRYPSEQEEVVPTKLAPVGPENRVDRLLQGVADAYASKVD